MIKDLKLSLSYEPLRSKLRDVLAQANKSMGVLLDEIATREHCVSGIQIDLVFVLFFRGVVSSWLLQ
jgi:hypothetical protein